MKGTQHTGSQKVHHLLQLLQQGPGGCRLFNRTTFSLVYKEVATHRKVQHLLQLLQQGPGSCSLFNRTNFSLVHKETATYRKPEGASPSAAVAAGTWQLPPVQQDNLHTCTQRDSNIQEARRCITCCSCCSSDLAAAAISTRHYSLMCTKKKQCTGTQKVHQLLQLLQQVTGSCSLFNRTNFSHVHNETATYRKP